MQENTDTVPDLGHIVSSRPTDRLHFVVDLEDLGTPAFHKSHIDVQNHSLEATMRLNSYTEHRRRYHDVPC